MNRITLHANCFDASALVKLHVDEEGTENVRAYFNSEATKYTTQFCFYEALGVLKVKWKYRSELSKKDYLEAAFKLASWYSASSRSIEDIDINSPEVFGEAKKLVDKTGLDLSDVLQILSVKNGYFSHMVGDSKTILVTADKDLASVAREQGIRSWYFIDEPAP